MSWRLGEPPLPRFNLGSGDYAPASAFHSLTLWLDFASTPRQAFKARELTSIAIRSCNSADSSRHKPRVTKAACEFGNFGQSVTRASNVFLLDCRPLDCNCVWRRY